MKKRTRNNLIMVLIIALIVGGGFFGVGYVRGWFDNAHGAPTLCEIAGVARIERLGIETDAANGTVLRTGDIVTMNPGATAVIEYEGGRVTLGGSACLTVTDADAPTLTLTAGEAFAHTEATIRLLFETETSAARSASPSDGRICLEITQATAMLSYRSGAQTVSVFRGAVDGIAEGQAREYVGGTTTERPIQAAALNSFAIAQIRKTNKTTTLCVTDSELDTLEEIRRQEIEDQLNGVTTPPVHTHAFDPVVVAPTCTEGGYIEYVCGCGESYRDTFVPEKGHDFGIWEVHVEATSTTVGRMERVCRVCGETEQRQIDTIPETHTHSYTAEVVAPTCTQAGYTVHVCACGDLYRDSEVPATGHSYQTQTVAPTCTQTGYTVHTCACSDRYVDAQMPATGHKWGAWKTTQAATKDEPGQKERICSRCAAKQEAEIPATGQDGIVYITIRCDTILDNMQNLTPGKAGFVPADGVILPMVKVTFEPGETVFDVLKRVCAQQNIQMEYSWTPNYGSYYIEGINQLYEFDCGLESGWMYKVNEWFPNYGCSSYSLEEGDVIVWCYTCNGLGKDVGSEWMGE